MARLDASFDSSQVEPQTGDFAPLPAGEYQVRVASSELKPTKAGDGQYIKLRLDVIGPTHAGRVLFSNINIRNKNPKAEDIGRQQLSSICRAIGVPVLNDTDELIGGTLLVKVTVKSDEYGEGNEVKAYKAIGGSVAPAVSAPPRAASAPTAPAAGGAAPPWARK